MKCSGNKIIHPTIRDAGNALRRTNKKKGEKKARWIYFCPDCEGYHITSWSKRQMKRRL